MGNSSSTLALAPLPTIGAAADANSNTALFIALAQGKNQKFLLTLAILMGLGKGGVPGCSMMAVALNAINAPDLPFLAGAPSGMDLATVLQVPVTCLADLMVVARNIKLVAWSKIPPLLSTTIVGIALAQQMIGKFSPDMAKTLVGSVLAALICLNLSIGKLTKTDGDSPPNYVSAWWFVGMVGITGGFATVLTNSMGPMLDIYLLTLKLEPFVQIATRAGFFTLVNAIKLVLFVYSGNSQSSSNARVPWLRSPARCKWKHVVSCTLPFALNPGRMRSVGPGILTPKMLLLGGKLGIVSLIVRLMLQSC